MFKIKQKLTAICIALLSVSMPFLFAACNESTKTGMVTKGGVTYQVGHTSATVVGVDKNAQDVTIASSVNGVSVTSIKENAMENAAVENVSFSSNMPEGFSIGNKAFYNSSIESIKNLPASATLAQHAFQGISKLKSISVQGAGNLSVENGALISTVNNAKYVRLLPAAAEPQANFENGTYTLTGVYQILDHALENNMFITDIVIKEDVKYVNNDACTNIELNSVTILSKDTFIAEDAFTVHKDLKVFVSAETNSEVGNWLKYSKNFIYRYNWLVHPVGCTNSAPHIHGLRDAGTGGSMEGFTYSYDEATGMASIHAGSFTITRDFPDYMKKTYEV